MESFLRKVPDFIKSLRSSPAPFGIVLGNESGDLDSVVCSCVLAAWLHRTERKPFIPLMNFKREDLPLRTEVTFCFNKLGLDLSSGVAFVDDMPWHELGTAAEVALVDHNVVNTPALQFLDGRVTRLLDHHVLERSKDAMQGLKVNVVETVGSCSTLVLEHILSKDGAFNDIPSLKLIRWAILMDTVNLSEERKKVTPKDVAILERIESLLTDPEPRDDIFNAMSTAKADISSFTAYQLLRKDMKAVYFNGFTVAMSTIPGVSLKSLSDRVDLCGDLDMFLKSEDFAMSVILTDGGGVVVYPAEGNGQVLVKRLLGMGVVKMAEVEMTGAVCMERTSAAYTRKKLMPIVKETFEGV